MVKINFKIIKNSKNNKKNLISCSFFAMKLSYRNFSKYENYLKKFCLNAQKLEDYTIRIYVDKTTKDNPTLKEVYDLYDNIEIIEYECKEFLIDNFFHNGTFGTLVRLYPLFDQNDKHEIVRVSDIDLTESYFLNKEQRKMDQYDLDYFFLTYFGYFKEWVNPNLFTNMAAGFILSKVKFPIKMFDDYLNELHENKSNTKTSILVNKIRESTQYKYVEINNYLPYGIDELFLNYYLYPYIIQNKISYGMRVELFPSQFINYIKYNSTSILPEIKMKKLINEESQIYYENKKIIKIFIEDFFNFIESYKDKIDKYFDESLSKAKKYKKYFTNSLIILLLPSGKLIK